MRLSSSEAVKLFGRLENTIPSQLAVTQSGSVLFLESRSRRVRIPPVRYKGNIMTLEEDENGELFLIIPEKEIKYALTKMCVVPKESSVELLINDGGVTARIKVR